MAEILKPQLISKSISECTCRSYSYREVIIFNHKLNVEKIEHVDKLLVIRHENEELGTSYNQLAKTIFCEIQHVLKMKLVGEILFQVVLSSDIYSRLASGLSGLLKTASLENPHIVSQLIICESTYNETEVLSNIQKESIQSTDDFIYYQAGLRKVKDWTKISKKVSGDKCWKDNGIYLITGGTGGLGKIFAKELAKNTKDAIIILTGRTKYNEKIDEQIERLEEFGISVEYFKMDVTVRSDVDSVIAQINKRYGNIDGILHCAGILNDSFIINKTPESFEEALGPKILGLINLDKATERDNLDFFVLFSSVASSLGSIGQADYSAANGFMDSYSSYRNLLVSEEKRKGRTISINWPLWEQGGMNIDAKTLAVLEKKSGLSSLPTEIGMEAFYEIMSLGQSQMMCLYQTETNMIGKKDIMSDTNMKYDNRDLLIKYISTVLADILKMPMERFDSDTQFEKYGIDSIIVMRLTDELEKKFGTLPKTLFFEYKSISELADYFFNNHIIRKKGVQKKRFIEKAITEDNSARQFKSDNIAIVGVAGRYPKAENKEQFWQNLYDGIDCVTKIPESRWDAKKYQQIEGKDKYCIWGGFLESIDKFDPLFFNISPKEAELMDPQQRLFLECVYETLEDSGYTKDSVGVDKESGTRGHVGVFVGAMYDEYQLYGAEQQIQGNYIGIGGNISSIANRISYYFDFNGPSMTIDTMCSSSLTAIHLACKSIEEGSCTAAIAGGINVSIHPNKYLVLSQGGFSSSKGKCESFGKDGDGYVPCEGVGAILLKPLSKAIEDRDNIYAVIKGTSINHGGRTNGYTVPNPNAQREVIDNVLKMSGVNPRAISYIEAHGTGTKLGDPIEIQGLSQAFKGYTNDTQFCSIGSVKSVIGHGESVAGMAGVTKVLMQMKYGYIAPSLHSERLNPYIDFEKTPFKVQRVLEEWNRPKIYENGLAKEYPLIAGISSFGAGGSNAHILIEEYTRFTESNKPLSQNLNLEIIPLSAKSYTQVLEQSERLLNALAVDLDKSKTDIASIAYTLQIGREHMDYRLAILVSSIEQLKEKLKKIVSQEKNIENVFIGEAKARGWEISFLSKDDDMMSTVKMWINKRKFPELLSLWVRGFNFDWSILTEKHHNVRRISLPTYPFANEHYWIPTNADKNNVENVELSHKTNLKKDNDSHKKDVSSGIQYDLIEKISLLLKIPRDKIDIEEPLSDLGFDSMSLVELAGNLGDYYNLEITPDVFFSYSTISRLSEYLATNFVESITPLNSLAEIEVCEEDLYSDETIIDRVIVNNEIRDEISIIGMSGVFPNANNIDELWTILTEGKEVINEFPSKRLSKDDAGFQTVELRRMGVISDIDQFDPAFFEISPKEAMMMDPRQRLLLVETWRALEDAGFGKEKISHEKVAMFVGVEEGDYNYLTKNDGNVTSNSNAVLAARIAYFLNLRGVNMAIDTACSSGLVALHEACLSLWHDECDTAIVAGVNLLTTPIIYDAMQHAGMLSTDGHCYAFDKRANGMVPGEAVAVIVLKGFKKAINENLHIYANIIGSGVNYDGKTNGITAPNGEAQKELMRDIYSKYNIKHEDVEYIITHGTGTKLGDPIEINALTDVYRDNTNKSGFCALTSNKPNIGHTQAASGLVSVINLVLALNKGIIPPSINAEQQNEYIHWKESPFYINKENRIWRADGQKKRIGAVSAFGFSGTNAHVVLTQYETEEELYSRLNKQGKLPSYLFLLSGKTQNSLRNRMNNLADMLESHEEIGEGALSSISYTLLKGRHHFQHRCAIVISGREEAIRLLRKAADNEKMPNITTGTVEKGFATQELIDKSKALLTDNKKFQETLFALGELYCLGYEPGITGLWKDALPEIISIPTYAFDNKSYWANDRPIIKKRDNSDKISLKNKAEFSPLDTYNQSNIREESNIMLKTFEELQSSLANELYLDIEEIDLNKSFIDMGLDSVIGVEWVKEINKKFGIQISTTKLYEYPNIIDLAKYIEMIKKDNKSKVFEELKNSLAEELFIDISDIDSSKSFMEMGLDSVVGVEWIRNINKLYQVNLSSTVLYQYPTLNEISEYLTNILKLEEPSAESNPPTSIDGDHSHLDYLLDQIYSSNQSD